MKLLEQVESGPKPMPRRVLVYGTQGVGKTTFASKASKPVFIQTEDGLGGIDADKFPLARAFPEVMGAISELYTEKHPYRTVAVDSLDWLERLVFEEVCRKRGVESIEEIPYAKGYVFALTQWRQFLEGLSALRNDRGMTVLLIAHSRIESFRNPETDTYDRYVPRLHRLAAQLVGEWCDEILFCTYRVHTRTTEEGFDRKRTQAIGTGERVIRTTERPAHIAKNRLSLPDELPLEWEAFSKFLGNGTQKGGK